jgi:hypothetical protein
VSATPQRNAGVSLPVAVDYRLDQLVDAANELGARTTRKELLALLVVEAEVSAELVQDLLRYRQARVRDVLIAVNEDLHEDDNVIRMPARRPGPRVQADSGPA